MNRFNKKIPIALILIAIILGGIFVPLHEAKANSSTLICGLFPSLCTAAAVAGAVIMKTLPSDPTPGLITTGANMLDKGVKFKTDLPMPLKDTWRVIRDFVNMFFILILIIIAFGTIFNIEEYTYRKLLPKLIIAALLINFSLVIGEFVASIAESLTVVSLKTIASTPTREFSYEFSNGFSIVKLIKTASNDAAFSILSSMALFIGMLAFIAMGFMSLIRLPMIWLLLIFSPVAWIGYTLPGIRKATWTRWWRWFMAWTFFIPIFVFISSIGFTLIRLRNQDILKPSTIIATAEQGGAVGGTVLSAISSATSAGFGITDLFIFIITLVLVVGGAWFSFKVAASLGGGVAWVTSKALTPAKWGWKGAKFAGMKATGSMREGAKRTLERMHSEGLPTEGALGLLRKAAEKSKIFKGYVSGELDREGGRQKWTDRIQGAAGFEKEYHWNKDRVDAGDKTAGWQREKKLDTGEWEFTRQINAAGTEMETFITVLGKAPQKLDTWLDEEFKEKHGNYENALKAGDKGAMALSKIIAEEGVQDVDTYKKITKAYAETNPLALTWFGQAGAKGNYKSIGDDEAIKALEWAHMDTPRALGFKKAMIEWLKTGGGELATDNNLDISQFAKIDAASGGKETNEWWGNMLHFLKRRPDLAIEHFSSAGVNFKTEAKDGRNAGEEAAAHYIVGKMQFHRAHEASIQGYRNKYFTQELARQIQELDTASPSYKDASGQTKVGEGASEYGRLLRNIQSQGGPQKDEKINLLHTAMQNIGIDADILKLPKFDQRYGGSSAMGKRFIYEEDYKAMGYDPMNPTDPYGMSPVRKPPKRRT
ncbi:MAG: sulfite exporter TauE/SafE family protein [Parcubacteria group bacterium]